MAKAGADRVRAHRVRKKAVEAAVLSDDDAAFIDNYEETLPPRPAPTGKSASERVVHIEERAAAEGDHVHPEAYAAMARAEGLRADTLLRITTDRLIQCNDQYMKLMVHMMERSTRLEDAHVALLEVVRDHFLARISAEGQAQQLAMMGKDGDDMDEMLKMLELIKSAKELKGTKKVKKKPLGVID